MSHPGDEHIDAAIDALEAGDRAEASRAYERAAEAAQDRSPDDAAHLFVMASMHETQDPQRRDLLQEQAQLLFHDAADLDKASEVAFARAGDAAAVGDRNRARSLYVGSIALAGAYLAEHAYRSLETSRAIALEEVGDRIRHAAKALIDM